MNRKERRKLMKQRLKPNEIKTALKREGLDAIRYAVRSYSAAVAMVLYDKCNFGKPKIQMTLRQTENLFDSINKGYVKIEDLERTLYDELDIKIV